MMLTYSLMGNEYFKLNNRNLYYKNWIESDLFSEDRQFLNEVQILYKLNKKIIGLFNMQPLS